MKWDISVPEWKWEDITMDFILEFSKTKKGFTIIWVNVDWLTKFAHFIHGKTTYSVDNWLQLYIEKIVQLHGVLGSIVSTKMLGWHIIFVKACKKHLVCNQSSVRPSTPNRRSMEMLKQVLDDMQRVCVLQFA